ncbi:hypothetical protein Tco_0183142 [Tanacetum coccineum]
MKNVNTFVSMETKDRGRASKLAAGSSQAQITNSAEVENRCRNEEEKQLQQEDLKQMMMVVLVEEVYVEALQVKYRIIDWEVYSEDTRRYYKIIRVGNHTEAYQIFAEMLKKFDKDDLLGFG